ncbi:MAG: hypothetical protein ABIE94_03405 [archaeon]
MPLTAEIPIEKVDHLDGGFKYRIDGERSLIRVSIPTIGTTPLQLVRNCEVFGPRVLYHGPGTHGKVYVAKIATSYTEAFVHQAGYGISVFGTDRLVDKLFAGNMRDWSGKWTPPEEFDETGQRWMHITEGMGEYIHVPLEKALEKSPLRVTNVIRTDIPEDFASHYVWTVEKEEDRTHGTDEIGVVVARGNWADFIGKTPHANQIIEALREMDAKVHIQVYGGRQGLAKYDFTHVTESVGGG